MSAAGLEHVCKVVGRNLPRREPSDRTGVVRVQIDGAGTAAARVGDGGVESVALQAPDESDATVRVRWRVFVEVVEGQLGFDEALALDAIDVEGDVALARETLTTFQACFGPEELSRLPAWQLQVHLRDRSPSGLRELALECYGLDLPESLAREQAAAVLVKALRSGAPLIPEVSRRWPDPVRRTDVCFDPELLLAAYRALIEDGPEPVVLECWGCRGAAVCPRGPGCRTHEHGWALQSESGDHTEGVFGKPEGGREERATEPTNLCTGAFREVVESIPGACRARLKVYRKDYGPGHLPHTDAGELLRAIIPIVPGGPRALSVEPTPGALAEHGLYRTYDLDEPGRVYELPTWHLHSGRNTSAESDRVFLIVSQPTSETHTPG